MELQSEQVEAGLDANGVPLDNSQSITKMTTESLKSGELIYNAIQVWVQETKDLETYHENLKTNPEFAKPLRNPFWIGQGCTSDMDPSSSLLFVINKVRTSHLNDALLTLPFSTIIHLFHACSVWTRQNNNPILVNRLLVYLMQNHHDELVSTSSLKLCLEQIKLSLSKNIRSERQLVGYNLAALKFLKQERLEAGTVVFGTSEKEVEEERGIKRKRVVVVS